MTDNVAFALDGVAKIGAAAFLIGLTIVILLLVAQRLESRSKSGKNQPL